MVHSRITQLVLFCLISCGALAQSTTRTDSAAEQTTTKAANGKTNLLVVPWLPKMFNGSSDVTKDINTATGQTYAQIQEVLRKGMCDQFKKTFSAGYNVTTLLDDTVKMKVDLMYTYNVTTTEYISINAPLNPAPAPKKDVKNAAVATTTGIKNGELQVQQAEGEKFMNTVILSPNLLDHLKKIYNCEYVVFLNQLDLQNDLGTDPYNTQQNTDYKRSAVLHWTIFSTKTGNRVAMGRTKGLFSNTINTPKKIIDGAFATVSKAVYDKFTLALTPKK
ncbi:MAG TPA: hypothetical protein VK826_20000 [Bacteroidia bacterium]|nr:hypothetical protein [Bacteroidia bacterium]